MIAVLEANAMPNVESLLRDHVTLQVDCIDRLYLNGYVPLLQRPENLWWFLHEHRKHPVISPALLKKITDRFAGSNQDFARQHKIPVVHFEPDQRRRVAIFMSKFFARLVRPVLHRVDPAQPTNADDPLRRAWLPVTARSTTPLLRPESPL